MHIANVTSRTLVIPPKAIICEIQPVTIEDHKKEDYLAEDIEENIFDQISIDSTNLTNDQHQAIIDLIKRYEHIFSANDHDIGLYGPSGLFLGLSWGRNKAPFPMPN